MNVAQLRKYIAQNTLNTDLFKYGKHAYTAQITNKTNMLVVNNHDE